MRLREELRPLDLLLSLGAFVEESLSTRLDSVLAPERLCEDRERLDPDDRLREFPPDRFRDFDDELFDELLLLDLELRWGILPGSS